jgi:ADP-ribose pyrophosphatase
MSAKVADAAPVEKLYEGRFLRLLREGRWEYVQRCHSSGAVHVVAITDSREIVLVEQPRVPVHARTIELPAGIMGDSAEFAHESAEACALRELLEETGFQGETARLLCGGPNAPGLTSERSNLVRVSGLSRIHSGGGVGGEDITTHVVPLAEVREWLQGKQAEGLLIEPRIYAGLYFALIEADRADAMT